MNWRLHPLAALHWRTWDGESVVFDQGSGQTHLLDTPTAVCLLMIAESAVSSADLLAGIADELNLPADPQTSDALHIILERLSSAGLIESSAP